MEDAFLCEYCVWTVRDVLGMPEGALGCSSYREQTKKKVFNSFRYAAEARRGHDLILKPRRSDRLLESLKDLESALEKSPILAFQWCGTELWIILGGAGQLVRVDMAVNILNIERINLEKSFTSSKLLSSAELQVNKASFGPACSWLVIATCSQLHLITLTTSAQRSASALTDARISSSVKLAATDMVTSLQIQDELLLVSVESETSSNCGTLVYSTAGGQLEPRMHIIGAPFLSCFCAIPFLHQVYLIEQIVTSPTSSAVSCQLTRYGAAERVSAGGVTSAISAQELQRTTFNLPALPLALVRHPWRNVMLLTLTDGSLVFLEAGRANCISVYPPRSGFRVDGAAWHPEGGTFLAWSHDGQLRLLDLGLNSLPLQIQESALRSQTHVNVLKYFRCNKRLLSCVWSSNYSANLQHGVLLLFDNGPMSVLRITANSLAPASLAELHCRRKQPEQALSLLRGMSWLREPLVCLALLEHLANYVLNFWQPNTSAEQVAHHIKLLEEALATFFEAAASEAQKSSKSKKRSKGLEEPAAFLPAEMEILCREQLQLISRRLFYTMLHADQLEKAALLASDLGSLVLFHDLRQIALQRNDRVLAEATQKRITQLMLIENPESVQNDEQSRYWFAPEELRLPPAQQRDTYFGAEDRLIEQFQLVLSGHRMVVD